MYVDKANKFYMGPERYNCAQAILKAFQQIRNIDEQTIKKFKNAGAGKAQDGLCGALYAAKHISKSDIYKKIENQFIDQAGSNKCSEIRKTGKLKCSECVTTTAKLLTDHI